MKQTLRQAIEKMLEDLIARQELLDSYIKSYVESDNFLDAAINKVKRDTLQTVRVRLEDALKN